MASQSRIDEIIEEIFQDSIQMYKDVEFDSRDLHDCLLRLMECVELIPELVGADKKKVVTGVIKMIIHHLQIKEIDKEKIMFMLTHDIIDMMIDLIVKLTRSPSKINTVNISETSSTVSKPERYCEIL
jgi:hypothetical protein